MLGKGCHYIICLTLFSFTVRIPQILNTFINKTDLKDEKNLTRLTKQWQTRFVLCSLWKQGFCFIWQSVFRSVEGVFYSVEPHSAPFIYSQAWCLGDNWFKGQGQKTKKGYQAECFLFLFIQEGWRTKIFCHLIVTNVFFQKEQKC